MQKTYVSDRVDQIIKTRTKVSDIKKRQKELDKVLGMLSNGKATERSLFTMTGLESRLELSEQTALDFLCLKKDGTPQPPAAAGRGNIHRFDTECDGETKNVWCKPNPTGRNYLDFATAYMVEVMYQVLTNRMLCTHTRAVKVHASLNIKEQSVDKSRLCFTSLGVNGVAFDDLIFMMDDLKAIDGNPDNYEKHKKLLDKLFPGISKEEQIELGKDIYQFLDWESVSLMFLVHLIARLNDAKADNIMLDIDHDETGRLILIPRDIDFDLADANPLTCRFTRDYNNPANKNKVPNHGTAMKSIFFVMKEVMDREVHENARKTFCGEDAIFYILDIAELIYEHNQHYENEQKKGHTNEDDFIEDGEQSAILIKRFREGTWLRMFEEINTLQNALTEPKTHRELLELLHKITAALYKSVEGTKDNPVFDLNEMYGLVSVQSNITKHDPNHEFNDELEKTKHINDEFNLPRLTAQQIAKGEDPSVSLQHELKSVLKRMSIESFSSLEKQLQYLNQIGHAFDFVDNDDLNLSQEQLDEFLYQSVKYALPGATKLLIRLGANVNQDDEKKKPYREQPLLHMLLENYAAHDFETRVRPTLEALASCTKTNMNGKNADGDTPTNVFTRLVDPKEHQKEAEQIFSILSQHGAMLVKENDERQHAFDIAYNRVARKECSLDLCYMLIEKFSGGKFSTTSTTSINNFIRAAYKKANTEDKKLLDGCLRSISQLAFETVLDRISSKKKIEGWIEFEGAISGVRYLDPKYQNIFDEKGHIRKSNVFDEGVRDINSITFNDKNIGIFFKEKPEMPGVEYLVYSFRQKLLNHGAAYTEVFKFKDSDGKAFDVQLSSLIHGTNMQLQTKNRDGTRNLFNKINHRSWSGMALTSMILNPEDDKPDNFILTQFKNALGELEYLIESFDNDHHLVNGVGVIKNMFGGKAKLLVKSMLFCMDQMLKPLDQHFVQEFLSINVDDFIQEWLTDGQTRYDQNNQLFGGQKPFPTPFTPEIMDQIYRKMHLAQEALREASQKNKQLTAIELLKLLEPQVAVRYEEVLKKHNAHLTRFREVTNESYNYKEKGKSTSFTTQIRSDKILESQGIPHEVTSDIDEANKYSPAQAKEYHRALVEDKKKINTVLKEFKKGITTTFDGIKFDSIKEEILTQFDFAGLKTEQQKNIIKALISHKIAFNNLALKNCSVLTNFDLSRLLANCNSLNTLNLKGCTSLTDAIIGTIDRSKKCETLEELVLNKTNISKLVIKKLNYLKTCFASDCSALEAIDITTPNLKHLVLTNDVKLTDIKLNARDMKVVKVKGATNLSQESLATVIRSSNFQNIELDESHLDIDRRFLTMKAVKNHVWNPKLLKLLIVNNTLDLSGFPGLNDNDLTNISYHCKDDTLPIVTALQLNGCHVPKRGLRKFLLEHPECDQVQYSDNLQTEEQQLKHNQHMEQDESLKKHTTLTTGDVLSVDSDNITLFNGITGEKIANIQQRQRFTKKIRSMFSRKKRNEVDTQVEQLNDHLVLICRTDKKTKLSRLYTANTVTYELREIPLPEIVNTSAAIAVKNQHEIIIASGNKFMMFNPHSKHVNKQFPAAGHIRQCRYFNDQYITLVYNNSIHIIEPGKKTNNAHWIKNLPTYLKDVVYLPGHYFVAYSEKEANIIDLNTKSIVETLSLPEHSGINDIIVDQNGALICSLKNGDGGQLNHTINLTQTNIDVEKMRKSLGLIKLIPFKDRLCITAERMGEEAVRNRLITYLSSLFATNIVSKRYGTQYYLEMSATPECKVSEMVDFMCRLNPTVRKLSDENDNIVDLKDMFYSPLDIQFMAHNRNDITQIKSLRSNCLTEKTLNILLATNSNLAAISLARGGDRGSGRRALRRISQEQTANNRSMQIKTAIGRIVKIHNLTGDKFKEIKEVIEKLPGYEVEEIKNKKSPTVPPKPPVGRRMVAKQPARKTATGRGRGDRQRMFKMPKRGRGPKNLTGKTTFTIGAKRK